MLTCYHYTPICSLRDSYFCTVISQAHLIQGKNCEAQLNLQVPLVSSSTLKFCDHDERICSCRGIPAVTSSTNDYTGVVFTMMMITMTIKAANTMPFSHLIIKTLAHIRVYLPLCSCVYVSGRVEWLGATQPNRNYVAKRRMQFWLFHVKRESLHLLMHFFLCYMCVAIFLFKPGNVPIVCTRDTKNGFSKYSL